MYHEGGRPHSQAGREAGLTHTCPLVRVVGWLVVHTGEAVAGRGRAGHVVQLGALPLLRLRMAQRHPRHEGKKITLSEQFQIVMWPDHPLGVLEDGG